MSDHEARATGYVVGVDLGQAQDYTALAVVRRLAERTVGGADAAGGLALRRAEPSTVTVTSRYETVHLERLPLGTSYPAIVQHVRSLVTRPVLRTRPASAEWQSCGIGGGYVAPIRTAVDGSPKLVVDSTGVGRPVVDMLRAAGLKPVAITITGSDAVTQDGSGYRVPKRDLIAAVQVLLQSGRLKIASALPDAAVLVRELLDYRVRISAETAHDSYTAREGAHDDILLALACAVWYAERRRPTRHAPPTVSYRSWGR